MNDCIFCKIINKEIPKEFRAESENLVAFDDINPETEIHILIVPKKHISGIEELREDHAKLLVEIFTLANKLVKEYNLENDLYRIRVNGGKAQHVPHIHFHLLGGEYKK